jgi:hypothetical protein
MGVNVIKVPLVTCVSVLLFLSCIEPVNRNHLETNQFWAYDFRRNVNYLLTAELLAEGEYCNIWVERGSGISEALAMQVANVFDNYIYHRVMDAFGLEFDIPGAGLLNTMEYADWLSHEPNGKLCILLLDIRDNYQIGVNESYIAGYFWSRDLYNGAFSNRRDMIYIDTFPGMQGNLIYEAYSTLAHEMQHLMNFVTSTVKRRVGNNIHQMDLWIDEGLSSAAEWVFAGEHLQGRVNWFNQNGRGSEINGLIDQGNNFFVWGNRDDENQYAILDDYSTVYLFFQWLRLQASPYSGDNSNIYKEIISSQYSDLKAVTSVMDVFAPGRGYSSWNVLLRTWLAANYINAPDGPYGYRNETLLNTVKTPAASSVGTTVKLAPGEGVYSRITENFNDMPAETGNIKYASLSVSEPFFHSSLTTAGRTLLTYNSSETNRGNIIMESGTTTGIPLQANIIQAARSVGAQVSGPLRISAGNLLGREPIIIQDSILNE